MTPSNEFRRLPEEGPPFFLPGRIVRERHPQLQIRMIDRAIYVITTEMSQCIQPVCHSFAPSIDSVGIPLFPNSSKVNRPEESQPGIREIPPNDTVSEHTDCPDQCQNSAFPVDITDHLFAPGKTGCSPRFIPSSTLIFRFWPRIVMDPVRAELSQRNPSHPEARSQDESQ
jgi:hypothetical protein